jgi:Arc/MetJ-type ribon-helix-helix transcriptional regulator
MPAVTVALANRVLPFVRAQIRAGGYQDATEYVHALIETAKVQKEHAQLEAQLSEAIDAIERGQVREMTAADWDRLRQRLRKSASRRRSS